jgi:hypothetical protein
MELASRRLFCKNKIPNCVRRTAYVEHTSPLTEALQRCLPEGLWDSRSSCEDFARCINSILSLQNASCSLGRKFPNAIDQYVKSFRAAGCVPDSTRTQLYPCKIKVVYKFYDKIKKRAWILWVATFVDGETDPTLILSSGEIWYRITPVGC